MTDRTVIAATDLSPRSAHVVGRAARIARRLGARLIVAHVADGGALAGLGRGAGQVSDLLDSLAAEHGGEAHLLQAPPDAALASLATDHAARILVLGLHNERRVLDLLRLTTMERITLAAPCPVLIAHQPPAEDYEQVLCATDFSAASAASLAIAAQIAPRARFHAVHALQLPLGAIFKLGHADTDKALTGAEALMDDFLKAPGLPALAEPPEIVPGGVHQVLAFRCAELAADLVCIGTHAGQDDRDLGNFARDLMRAPPTDLLIAKPGQDAPG
jgi:nucleotide-binding universal stress UspA family protein